MGKKTVIFFVGLLLLSVALISVPKTYSQTQDVKVVNYSWYVDSDGLLDVVGLVQNTGPNTISTIQMSGSVIGPNDEDIADSGTQVWVSDLLPSQEAPFYMEFMIPQSSSESISVSWYSIIQAGELDGINLNVVSANATSSYQYQGLTITSSKGSIGTSGGFNGAFVVNGVIKNTGDQSATNLTVVGAFFNSTGSVVGVGYTDYLTPEVLVPGNTTTFQIAAFDLNQSEVPTSLQIKSFQLLVQTQEPILQGSAPIVSPPVTGSAEPTDSSTVSPTSSAASHAGFNFSSILPIVLGVVIAVIVAAGAFTVVRQITQRRNSKPRQTVKEARKTKKQKSD